MRTPDTVDLIALTSTQPGGILVSDDGAGHIADGHACADDAFHNRLDELRVPDKCKVMRVHALISHTRSRNDSSVLMRPAESKTSTSV